MRGNSLDTQYIKVGKPKGKHPEKRLTAVAVRSMRKVGRYADGNGLYLPGRRNPVDQRFDQGSGRPRIV
jgi:hypothetical protein